MRDIDDWMPHFEREVGPRLTELLSAELDNLPPELAEQLKRLREAEAKILPRQAEPSVASEVPGAEPPSLDGLPEDAA